MSGVKRIVVCGGSGFLGMRICRSAIKRGWNVVSLSRHGEPKWSSVTSTSAPPPWASSVSWQQGDILKPETYKSQIKNADAVVHSMGILLEADYKGVVQGKISPIEGLGRAFSAAKMGTQNPLDAGEKEPLKPMEKDGQLTYEVMNRDSAISLAKQSFTENVATFVFISAAAAAPFIPNRYITTKREAETTISANFPSMRCLFIRPGFLYDSSRKFTLPIAAAGTAGAFLNSMAGGKLTSIFGAAVEKPVPVNAVAEAVIQGIADDTVKGVVGTGMIEQLASKSEK